MKVLSLIQPWAQLVVMGVKTIETRSWQTNYRGIVLIHASASMKKLAKELCCTPPFTDFIDNYNDLTRGAIIGQVCIGDNIRTEDIRVNIYKQRSKEEAERELAFGDYNPNRYGWMLHKPVMYKNPIPAKGALMLWDYAGAVPEYDPTQFIEQVRQGALL